MNDDSLSAKLESLNPSTETFLEMLPNLYQNNNNVGITSDLLKSDYFTKDRLFGILDNLKSRITKRFFDKAIDKAFFSTNGIYTGKLKVAGTKTNSVPVSIYQLFKLVYSLSLLKILGLMKCLKIFFCFLYNR